MIVEHDHQFKKYQGRFRKLSINEAVEFNLNPHYKAKTRWYKLRYCTDASCDALEVVNTRELIIHTLIPFRRLRSIVIDYEGLENQGVY
jgi:hypothetical protein